MDRSHRTGTFPGWGDGGERGGDIRYLVSLYMDTEQLEFRGNRVDRVVRRIYPKEQIIFRAVKLRMLFGIGLGMVIAGWLWGIELPVIKKLWTSSMVLVSSGYCFLLMGLFYYWIDYKGHRKYTTWLKVYGMNSILAYMLTNVVSFRCIGESLFFGTQQYLGNYYPVLIAMCNVSVIYVLLYAFYKHNIFLKV